MKKHINFNVPARLFDFSQDATNEKFSRGKLAVFYKGETGDKRLFTDSFSESLVRTLPYTPVVTCYDEEKDDFVGHAAEQQILGIVDPCKEPSFEVLEDGNTWCICDTVYYTERPDRVGELAKKIEGHSQSLELDPNTVKYVINYDEKKHFKNIEFTSAELVGVSVLGKNQKPAFTGSAFFSSSDFNEKMEKLKNYCENSGKQSQLTGGNGMNLNEFMKLSWGDVSCKVQEAICKEYANDAYTYIVDMFDDSAIVRFYYYMEEVVKTMRVYYNCNENGSVNLGNINEVRMTWTDVTNETLNAEDTDSFVEEKTSEDETEKNEVTDAACGDKKDDEDKIDCSEITDATCGDKKDEDKANAECNPKTPEKKDEEDFKTEPKKEDDPEDDDKEPEDDEEEGQKDEFAEPKTSEEPLDDSEKEKKEEEFVDAADTKADADNFEAAPDSSAEQITPTDMKVSVEDEQANTVQEENSSSTSFTESERAEFETLKREKKVALVNSYKEFFEEDTFNNFVEKIDSFETEDELELALLRAYKDTPVKTKSMRAFSVVNTRATNSNDELTNYVRKYLK